MKKVDHIRALAGLLVICFLFTSIISRAFNPLDFFTSAGVVDVSNADDSPEMPDTSDTQLFDEEEGEDKSERDSGDGKFCKIHFDVSLVEFFIEFNAGQSLLIACSRYSSRCTNFKNTPLYLSQRTLLL